MFKDCREEVKQAEEQKMLEARVEDKFQFAISKNKITHTDFLNRTQIAHVKQVLKEKSIRSYLFFGGNAENSERQILVFYPNKFSEEMVEKNFSKIVCGLHIRLPKDVQYEHRVYLSGIMKLGIKREKVGDILVRENGADIIILAEIADFLKMNLMELTRFKKATCEIIDINDVEKQERQFEDLSIIVSSMRLDNFVSELAKCSRTKAEEMLKEQRVFVNDQLEMKSSKKINCQDQLTIRGKGKFVVQEIARTTKSEKLVVNLKKFK